MENSIVVLLLYSLHQSDAAV